MNLVRTLTLLVAFGLAACSSTTGDRGLDILLPASGIRVGDRAPVMAQPREDLAGPPEWEVEEVEGGGFLNPRGLEVTYVAPDLAGRYHLVVRAQEADGTPIKVEEEVMVLPRPSIEPAQVSLAPGGRVVFAARMKGLPKDTVTWSLEEADGGLVGEDGSYQAPGHHGVFHIRATSTLDAEAVATAIVRVE